jgi:NADP-dependent 3-hydroxy acid dehydrogenase YdfG
MVEAARVASGLAALYLATRLARLPRSECNLELAARELRPERFRDCAAWVTGASSGIECALALALARLRVGVRLMLSARRGAQLEALAAQLRAVGAAQVVCVVSDVSDLASLDAAARSALAAFDGRIDFLFSDAGVSTRVFAQDANFHSVDERVMTVCYLR